MRSSAKWRRDVFLDFVGVTVSFEDAEFIHFAGFTMAYYTVFCVKVPNGF